MQHLSNEAWNYTPVLLHLYSCILITTSGCRGQTFSLTKSPESPKARELGTRNIISDEKKISTKPKEKRGVIKIILAIGKWKMEMQ